MSKLKHDKPSLPETVLAHKDSIRPGPFNFILNVALEKLELESAYELFDMVVEEKLPI